jgi:hypothetical protein
MVRLDRTVNTPEELEQLTTSFKHLVGLQLDILIDEAIAALRAQQPKGKADAEAE